MPKMPKPQHKRLTAAGKFSSKARRPAPSVGKAFQLDVAGFYLRSLRKPDATSDFVNWMNDADLLAGMNLPAFNMTTADLQDYIAKANNLHKYLIGIFTKPDLRLIGFYQIDVTLLHRRARRGRLPQPLRRPPAERAPEAVLVVAKAISARELVGSHVAHVKPRESPLGLWPVQVVRLEGLGAVAPAHPIEPRAAPRVVVQVGLEVVELVVHAPELRLPVRLAEPARLEVRLDVGLGAGEAVLWVRWRVR